MAVFAINKTAYTQSFLGLMGASTGFVNSFTSNLKLTSLDPRAGSVTARKVGAVTLQTPVPGTIMTNGAARTNVTLTTFNGAHVIGLDPTQALQFIGDADEQAKELAAFANAARLKAEAELIADLVGGTPGDSETLEDGQLDFATDGTPGEAYKAVNALDQVVSYVQANTQGKGGRISIVFNPTSWANFKSLRKFEQINRSFDRVGNDWFYDGLPVYVTTVSTNFGGASKAAAFVYHEDAEGLIWTEVDAPDGGFAYYGDGQLALHLLCYGHAGLIDNTQYGRVLNGVS